jgi:hypothetical protein
MRYSRIATVLVCVLAYGSSASQAVAQQPNSAQPNNPPTINPPINWNLTCAEFRSLLHSDPKAAGLAITWLDGYYSGRAGLLTLPSGWTRTVSQGIGGTCAIDVNATRPVFDVIAQLHAEYGGARR